MSRSKTNRSKSRETALQTLFCQQFAGGSAVKAAASVEATQTLEMLQDTKRILEEFKASTDAALGSVRGSIKAFAEAAKPEDRREDVKVAEGLMSARLNLTTVRKEAIETLRKSVRTLDETGSMFAEDGFTTRLLKTVSKHEDKIKTVLERSLEGWTTRRLTAEDRAILQLGIAELLYFTDVPERAVINEYIELAKKYCDNESPKLINGVLDRVLRDNPREKSGS